jgi:hypothetical protein
VPLSNHIRSHTVLEAPIHPSAWNRFSRKFISSILHMGRHRARFWSARPGCTAKVTSTSGGRGYKFTVTNVAFVATDMGFLPALVYLLVK